MDIQINDKQKKIERIPIHSKNPKDVSFIMTPEDFERVQQMKKRLSLEANQKISTSEVIRIIVNEFYKSLAFLFESPIDRTLRHKKEEKERDRNKPKKTKQHRSQGYRDNRKHVSLIMNPEDIERVEETRKKLSSKTNQQISISEIIRIAVNEICDEQSFLFESPPVKRGTRFNKENSCFC